MQQLPLWGYEVTEQVLEPLQIMGIDELFLTNAIRGIRWVSTCEGRDMKRGIAGTLLEKVLRSI
jgi:branched-subunit amino acid aminotransferase/4-amino-4-deoxychorismate lyase